MSTNDDRPSVLPYTELRAIQEQLIHLAAELPERIERGQLRGDLLRLAERLDREISITPRYTGSGNDVISGMIYNLASEMFGKFEALAGTIEPGYCRFVNTGDDPDE